MRGTPPGRHLGRVVRDEREAQAAVVQEDAGRRLQEVGTEVERVGLGQRNAEPVGIMRAQVRGVAVAEAGDVGAGRADAGRHVGWRHGVRADPGGGRGEAVGIEQRLAVGSVVEHSRAVVPDGAPGLDHQVGPPRVVGFVPEPDGLGHGGSGQGQVALRGGGHRPELVAPYRCASGAHHAAALVAKSVGAKWPVPRSSRPRPNSPR